MMGVVIFTHDTTPYKQGEYVEGEGIICSPTTKDLTVIAHMPHISKEECMSWLDYVAYRLVIVCNNPPKIKNDNVIYDKSIKNSKVDYMPAIQAVLKWDNKNRAWALAKNVPVPLMLSFLRENHKDIELWRLLAKSFKWCPNYYQMAAITFGCNIVARPSYPAKKRKQEENMLPYGFRESDMYRDEIILGDATVSNEIRSVAKDTLPKKAKKRKQKEMGWI